MRISELYESSPVRGADAVIIGSGPSLGVFPVDWLKGRVCITLNDTHKHLPDWVGPISFSNAKQWSEPFNDNHSIRIIKGRLRFDPRPEKHDNHVPWFSEDYYVFSYYDRRHGDDRDHFDRAELWREPDYYWNGPGGTVCILATQFALLGGAKSIMIVGCDCCELGGDAYVKGKKQRKFVKRKYHKDAEGMLIMFHEARKRFGVPCVSVTPFAGFGREADQMQQMQGWASAKS